MGRSIDSNRRPRQFLVDQICALAGGPCFYTGRDMKTALRTAASSIAMGGKKRKKGEEQNESDAALADAKNAENQSNVQLVGFRAVYV
jgi:hypothetical protein